MKQGQRAGRMDASAGFFQKWTAVFLACMGSVFILYCAGGYVQITRSKAWLFYILTGGYALVCIFGRAELALVGRRALVGPVKVWKGWDFTRRAVLLYWLAALVSTALAVDPSTALWGSARCNGLVTLTLYCLTFFLVAGSAQPKRWLLWLFGGAMAVSCVIALIQLRGGNPLGLYPAGMNYYDANLRYAGAFLATVGNVDTLSAVLCIAIPIFALSILRIKSPWRFALLVPLGLCLGVLAGAFVAGGVVGVALGALLTVPALVGDRRRRRIALAAVVAVLVAVLLLLYFFGERVGSFPAEASALLHGKSDDSFGSGRWYIWRTTVSLVPERPLFGGGPDTLALRTDAFFERFNETTGTLIHARVDNAHNEYLGILVDQGAVGLLAYLAVLASAAVQWVRRAPQDDVSAICGGACLCYAIQAFFNIPSPAATALFWLCLALCVRRGVGQGTG